MYLKTIFTSFILLSSLNAWACVPAWEVKMKKTELDTFILENKGLDLKTSKESSFRYFKIIGGIKRPRYIWIDYEPFNKGEEEYFEQSFCELSQLKWECNTEEKRTVKLLKKGRYAIIEDTTPRFLAIGAVNYLDKAISNNIIPGISGESIKRLYSRMRVKSDNNTITFSLSGGCNKREIIIEYTDCKNGECHYRLLKNIAKHFF